MILGQLVEAVLASQASDVVVNDGRMPMAHVPLFLGPSPLPLAKIATSVVDQGAERAHVRDVVGALQVGRQRQALQ